MPSSGAWSIGTSLRWWTLRDHRRRPLNRWTPTGLEEARKASYYVLVHLALFTGLRRSEFPGLRWSDIDLERGVLSVQQTLHWVHGGRGLVFHPPKSRKGKRSVALSSTSVLLLRSHRERQEAERIPGELPQGRSQRPRVHPPQWATDVAGDRQPHLRQDRPQDGLSPPPAPRSATHARHACATAGRPFEGGPGAIGPCYNQHDQRHIFPRAPRDSGGGCGAV